MKDYKDDTSLNVVRRDMHQNYNGILLTKIEFKILKNYGFDIERYRTIKDLIFDLEETVNYTQNEELESILNSLSEFDYYHNTNK